MRRQRQMACFFKEVGGLFWLQTKVRSFGSGLNVPLKTIKKYCSVQCIELEHGQNKNRRKNTCMYVCVIGTNRENGSPSVCSLLCSCRSGRRLALLVQSYDNMQMRLPELVTYNPSNDKSNDFRHLCCFTRV